MILGNFYFRNCTWVTLFWLILSLSYCTYMNSDRNFPYVKVVWKFCLHAENLQLLSSAANKQTAPGSCILLPSPSANTDITAPWLITLFMYQVSWNYSRTRLLHCHRNRSTEVSGDIHRTYSAWSLGHVSRNAWNQYVYMATYRSIVLHEWL
jgi:hypothetical protein